MSTPVTPERFDAVLFDLDGVLTSTAKVHAACWKETFDDFLRKRAEETGEPFREFTLDDYHRYVDGKPRYDGVRSFLASRGIHLPEGDPADPPGTGTVCAVGNRKNALVKQAIRSQGVEVYEGSIAWVRQLLSKGIKVAVVSSSKNCATVLDAAGITELFQARVDGLVAAEQGLPGKPAPDIFLEAARRVGVEPARAVVVEDAISGVQAGRAGHFGLVIGVARTVPPDDLRAGGADVVVADLGELLK
jgi:beta-phosphoglucomutase family hydrolase